MASHLVRDLIAELPFRMRDSVEGYVDAVAAALPDIQQDARMELPADKIDLFLFLVAIRRIWAAVNTQFWIISDSVSIAESRNLNGFQVGRDQYASGSDAFIESRELRVEFQTMIRKLGIEEIVTANHLRDVLRLVLQE